MIDLTQLILDIEELKANTSSNEKIEAYNDVLKAINKQEGVDNDK